MLCHLQPLALAQSLMPLKSPGCEFLSDAPFSNIVSALQFMQTNCTGVNGWTCTHELYNIFIQASSKVTNSNVKFATVTELVLWVVDKSNWLVNHCAIVWRDGHCSYPRQSSKVLILKWANESLTVWLYKIKLPGHWPWTLSNLHIFSVSSICFIDTQIQLDKAWEILANTCSNFM